LHVFKKYITAIAGNKKALQTIFYSLALLSVLFNYKYHILAHQIGRNPILYQEIDPVYWLFMAAGLPTLIGTTLAPFLDVLLAGSCIIALIWNKHNAAPVVFFTTHFIYFLFYNIMAGHHYINIGMLVMSFPFMFYNPLKFAAAFSFCRFLFCFMMASAGVWKVVRGNLFYPDQAHMLLVSSHVEQLLSNDVSNWFGVIRLFIAHKAAGHLLWVLMILLELAFFAGFFTLKKDRLLLVFYILFAVGGWLFFSIFNYENIFFLLTLTPVVLAIKKLTSLIASPSSKANAPQ